ncbi:hypothetical protein JHW43_008437 [Diplocarpon mali]|nr:hypothetical protein JHW43_008437 [Diplocarpon mali]
MPRYSRYKSTSSSSGDRGSSSSSSDPCSDINPSNPIPYPSSDSSDRRRRSMAPSPPPHSSYRRRSSSPHRPDSQTPTWSSSSADGSATPARSQTPTLRDAYGSHECRATGGDCRSPSPTREATGSAHTPSTAPLPPLSRDRAGASMKTASPHPLTPAVRMTTKRGVASAPPPLLHAPASPPPSGGGETTVVMIGPRAQALMLGLEGPVLEMQVRE